MSNNFAYSMPAGETGEINDKITKKIIIDGEPLYYIDVGSGPTVVLLHGNPTSNFYYRELIEQLRHTHRVIAPNYIGFGSPRTANYRRYSIEDRVVHLETLMEQLKLSHFTLVMHDWGGPIGTALAIKHHSKIVKIVYLNTTLSNVSNLPFFLRLACMRFPGRWLTEYTGLFLFATFRVATRIKLKADVYAEYIKPFKAHRKYLRDFVEGIPFENEHPNAPFFARLTSEFGVLQDKPIKLI